MKKNTVFADACNYFINDGMQIIRPEKLQELDTTEIAVPFGNEDEVAVQKYRDLLKASTVMMDDEATYLILGVENESDVKYAEPVKVGLYDFLQYSKQVQQTAARHREANDRKGHESGEFLSGFYKEDTLTPVITLVILFDSKAWDGPRTLHSMMSTKNPNLLKYAADYKINLIEPAAMSEEDLDKLQTNLRGVLGFIKYSNDSEALNTFLSRESSLHNLDVEAARVISMCTNTQIDISEDAEVVDVCKAVQDMNNKARQDGRLEALRDSIKNAMESFHLSMEEAMIGLKVSQEDQAVLRKMI